MNRTRQNPKHGFLLILLTGLILAGAMFFAFRFRPAGQAGSESMPEDGMPYLFQFDEKWKDQSYGDGTIELTGCGPTALAMAMSALLGVDVTPVEVAAFSEDYSYYVNGAGTAWALFEEYPAYYGISSYQSSRPETIRDALKSGAVLVMSMGPGDFTSAGHIICAKEIDEHNQVNVHDPNSESRSTKWNLETLLSQAACIWILNR